MPLLLLHGTADRITDPLGSQTLFDRAPAVDKTILVYDGWYHELHNEKDRQRVLDDITDWLKERATVPTWG
jgi:alpha-beta hydrolase superfamily lysophospholipase